MLEIPINSYIFALFAVLLVAVAGFILVIHSMKDIKIKPISIKIFNIYFLLASISWVLTIARDLVDIEPKLYLISVGYFIATGFLFPAFLENFRIGKKLYGLIVAHAILIICQFILADSYAVFITIILYTIFAYGYLFIRITRIALQYKNIGYALIACACFIISAVTPFELYYLIAEKNINLTYTIGFIATASCYILLGIGFLSSVLISVHQQLLKKHTKLKEIAYKDPLTGLFNRRGFELSVDPIIALSKRNKNDISAIVIDIDYFKKINDNYGHDKGDMVLHTLGKIITLCLRESDICARFGGEEFIVLLPYTYIEDAVVIAERIGRAIRTKEIHLGQEKINITASLGVASQSEDFNLNNLVKKADEALYNAKEQGRNRVEQLVL